MAFHSICTLYTKDNWTKIHLVSFKQLRCEGRTLLTSQRCWAIFLKTRRKQTAGLASLCGEDGGFDILCSEYGSSKYTVEKTMDLFLTTPFPPLGEGVKVINRGLAAKKINPLLWQVSRHVTKTKAVETKILWRRAIKRPNNKKKNISNHWLRCFLQHCYSTYVNFKWVINL